MATATVSLQMVLCLCPLQPAHLKRYRANMCRSPGTQRGFSQRQVAVCARDTVAGG